ncbi:MAG: hypothetical protein AAGD86_09985, partial [Pseudomonadota bacterium]
MIELLHRLTWWQREWGRVRVARFGRRHQPARGMAEPSVAVAAAAQNLDGHRRGRGASDAVDRFCRQLHLHRVNPAVMCGSQRVVDGQIGDVPV